MTDITLSDVVVNSNSNLTRRFIVTGVVVVIIIVAVMTLRGYYVLRSNGIENEAHRVGVKVTEVVNMVSHNVYRIESRHILRIGESFKHLNGFESVAIYTPNLEPLWPMTSISPLSAAEQLAVQDLLTNSNVDEQLFVLDSGFLSTWPHGPLGQASTLPVLVKLKNSSGTVFSVARINYNFESTLNYALDYSLRIFLFSAICLIILFFALYYTFQHVIKTIERQEGELNHQITRLSNLLLINKNMQRSMKTASARAVELNEQFLRRTGADLHDGPAQMIGFAVMRLNQVSKQEEAKSFGQEFHAVRQALEDSLVEIRGISSGLVLPELENLSLEQCLRKVVTLHGANSKAEVDQYYQGLADNIPLPLKICAYRFIQEGLNNAHRHGDATKCRLSVYVKDHKLVISLKDNGIGFRKSKLKNGGPHLGLIGLKDRVQSLGGSFSINSELGVGTALKLIVSLADEV
jgi:signal transduction histidine kinase